MRKILFILTSFDCQFTEIINLIKSEYKISVMAPEGTGSIENVTMINYTVHFVPPGSPLEAGENVFERTARSALNGLKKIRNEKFDLIFGQVSWGALKYVKEIFKSPLIGHIEFLGLEMKCARKEYPLSNLDIEIDKSQRNLVESSLSACDKIVLPTKYAASKLPKRFRNKAEHILEGFPIPKLVDCEKEKVRNLVNLPKDSPIIGYFGRTLEAVRGFDVFIKMAGELLAHIPKIMFLVIGKPITFYGNENKYLDRDDSFFNYCFLEYNLSKDNFIFVDNLPLEKFRLLIRVVDFSVFPIYENAGNWSFFECLCAGIPTISHRNCFFPEFIQDGTNGFLCEVGNYADFAEIILNKISDKKLLQAVGENARKTAKRKLSIKVALENYLALFNRVTIRVNKSDLEIN